MNVDMAKNRVPKRHIRHLHCVAVVTHCDALCRNCDALCRNCDALCRIETHCVAIVTCRQHYSSLSSHLMPT